MNTTARNSATYLRNSGPLIWCQLAVSRKRSNMRFFRSTTAVPPRLALANEVAYEVSSPRPKRLEQARTATCGRFGPVPRPGWCGDVTRPVHSGDKAKLDRIARYGFFLSLIDVAHLPDAAAGAGHQCPPGLQSQKAPARFLRGFPWMRFCGAARRCPQFADGVIEKPLFRGG